MDAVHRMVPFIVVNQQKMPIYNLYFEHEPFIRHNDQAKEKLYRSSKACPTSIQSKLFYSSAKAKQITLQKPHRNRRRGI